MKILAIQNRMGIGDMVIFLPFIEAISKKFRSPVSILVKKNSKAIHFLSDNKDIDEIIILERDNQNKNGRHDGISGIFNLANDLKKNKFDKVFIFNSSLRFNLVARLSGIKTIHQYPLFQKKNQHIIEAAKNFLKLNLNLNVESDPKIHLNEELINNSKIKNKITDTKLNILLGIGGSGPTKRVPSKIFIEFMELISKNNDCNFFLATGKNNEEQIILREVLNTKFKKNCYALDDLKLKDTLPIIKNCDISVCNDSSFSHLSSALGVQTIVLMADTPLIYGSYSPRMHPIIPDGESFVKHDTLGKNRIDPNKIIEKLNSIIN